MTAHPIQPAGLRWRRYRLSLRLVRRPFSPAAFLNVTLVVMLFMQLGSAYVIQPGVRLDLPVSEFVDGAPYRSLTIVLTQEGLVFFNDERLSLEELGPAFARAKSRNLGGALTIEADTRVPYGTLIRVVNLAAAAGLHQINLATRPGFGESVMP